MTPTEACRCPACVAAAGIIADKCGLTMVEAHDIWDRIDAESDVETQKADIAAALAPYGVSIDAFDEQYDPKLSALFSVEDDDGNTATVREASTLDDPRAIRMWALECAADIEDGIAQVIAAAAMIEDFILNGMPKAGVRFDA